MKKFKKALALLLAIVSCFAVTTTAFAASPQDTGTLSVEANTTYPSTFGPGRDQLAGEYTFTNDNWTPIKTLQGLGSCHRFYINGAFRIADDYGGTVKLTLKVKRVSDGAIIYSKTFYPGSNGEGSFNTAGEEKNYIEINPNEEKIQVYVDASTYTGTPSGHFRKLWIKYYFNLV